MRKFFVLPLVALIALAACSETPTSPGGEPAALSEIVITPGIQAPAGPMRPGGPLFSTLHTPTLSVGGSITTPVSVKGPTCAEGPTEVTIIYRVNGKQAADARFDVYTRWDYAGGEFSHAADVQQVVVKSRDNNSSGNDYYTVIISITNSDNTSGTASFEVKPVNLQTSGGPSDMLDAKNGAATVYVDLKGCEQEEENTAPSITVPGDITEEATSRDGAAVDFLVTANDDEDGNLTHAVACTVGGIPVHSGDLFPFGETIVECSVEDSGGLSATGSFKITVEDKTPPVFTYFPGKQTLIAANINGAVLDLESLGITAEDWNNVSEPVTIACDYTAGEWLAIGSTTTVSCTATDARDNTSEASTFDVFVTLDLSGMTGFQQPLSMKAPYSAHKAGSTIPHKFGAPRYADGTPATDLASGLRLTLTKKSGGEVYEQDTMDEYGAGSTAWRYSPSHYIFNLKTEKNWGAGDWTTTVSYAGIPLASTTFTLRN